MRASSFEWNKEQKPGQQSEVSFTEIESESSYRVSEKAEASLGGCPEMGSLGKLMTKVWQPEKSIWGQVRLEKDKSIHKGEKNYFSDLTDRWKC